MDRNWPFLKECDSIPFHDSNQTKLAVLSFLFNIIGYGLPNFTQLSVTSYYAASSASHYGISLITRYIEDTYMTRSQKQRLR